ncbi:MAG: uroporphyrinogen-III synthase [Candidatus Eisenbacteria bacterium]
MAAEERSEEGLLLQAAEAYGWTAPRDRPFVYLVARDDSEDDRLAAGLEANGFSVLRVPLLETVAGSDAARLPSVLASLPEGTALAWTSRRAGEALAKAAFPRHHAALVNVPLFALGDSSAEPVAKGGIAVATPQGFGPHGARSLADLIATRVAVDGIRRVLFLAGNRSLPDFPEGLAARGVPMERLEVYETRYLRPEVDDLLAVLGERRLACAVFFSPSGAEALEALLAPDALKALHAIPVAAKGPTTAAALRARGFRSVDAGLRTVTPRPSHPLAFLALHLMDETPR